MKGVPVGIIHLPSQRGAGAGEVPDLLTREPRS